MVVQEVVFTHAKWISDRNCRFQKRESPVPLVFQKTLRLRGSVKQAEILCTALGIYELHIDGQKVGKDYFAPGFTSYQHQIQVQRYEVSELLNAGSVLTATVAGGWAVGAFNYNRKSRIAADFPSLLLELHIEYTDGTSETVGTDESWRITSDGPVRAASWYDGETYDATVSLKNAHWRNADVVKPRGKSKLLEQYGLPVRVWRTMEPISVTQAKSGEWVYDFGQNCAGVIEAKLIGKAGQQLTFRHTELLSQGELYTGSLRTAKQLLTYTCVAGRQTYSPRLTYMGFRYVGVTGISPENIELRALALSSDVEETGSFACSNELLNRLNENIRWSARSNFVDIPTDCPQRDERLGWTGDIALFARTACYNYDMDAFLGKWLLDVSAEQGRFGGIPMVVPRNGHEWPPFTTSCWGDCCILVPWAEYLARGDLELLRRQYPTMKRFLASVKRWAALFSFGERRYIWRLLFQFGDWCAPQDPPEPWPRCVKTWMKRGPWIATAYFANSCGIVSQIAALLEQKSDADYYKKLRDKVVSAYRNVFTDGNGRLHEEFQTGYALPLYFGMTEGNETAAMAANLARLVSDAGNKLTTGFTGTPYLLFALSDNGYADAAYRLLMQDTYPSWLYEVKAGATTVWERWDALLPDGTPNPDGMVSFNHYAYGAVGDFLYRRVLGIEAVAGGYKSFTVKPILGGNLTWARGSVTTPYGEIRVHWRIEGDAFTMEVTSPEGTACTVTMPSGKSYTHGGGSCCHSEPLLRKGV